MKDQKKVHIEKTTSNRRELLKWLGQGTVLALGGSWITSCGSTIGKNQPEQQGFPFKPGSGNQAIFESWRERTVDPQELQEILKSWTLRVDGLVESPRTYDFAELIALTRTDQITDFHCVEGWSVYDVPWNGLHCSELFDQVKPLPTATHVSLHTIGGIYNESIPIEIAYEPKTLLAYGVSKNTIPLKHGFPLRLVVPRLLGYKNAKFIERIELIDKPVYGYWVGFGYPYDGDVPKARLRPGKY